MQFWKELPVCLADVSGLARELGPTWSQTSDLCGSVEWVVWREMNSVVMGVWFCSVAGAGSVVEDAGGGSGEANQCGRGPPASLRQRLVRRERGGSPHTNPTWCKNRK